MLFPIYKSLSTNNLEAPINSDWSSECLFGTYKIISNLNNTIHIKLSNNEKIEFELNKFIKIDKPIHATSIISKNKHDILELIEDGFDKALLPTSPKIFFNNASSNKMNWRRCERDVCVNLIGDENSNINFIRVQTELFNNSSTIQKSNASQILNLNSIFKTKDEQFKLWKMAGLNVPEYYLDNLNRKLPGEWLVRTNDQACANNILPNTPINIKKILNASGSRANSGFKKSLPMLVKRIMPNNGILYHGRIYFIKDYIFCSVCNLTHANKNVNSFYLQSLKIDKYFFKGHRLLEQVLEKYDQHFKIAMLHTGLDIGAIDFFYFQDNEPIFLEVNSYWGMGNIRWPHNNKDIEWLMTHKNDDRIINSLCMERFDEFGFWIKFYEKMKNYGSSTL